MTQQIVKAEVCFVLPADKVMVDKVEYLELKKAQIKGNWLTMKDFQKRSQRSPSWLRKKILSNPLFIKRHSIENGGWVHFPDSQQDHYQFKESGMTEFLEKEFQSYL